MGTFALLATLAVSSPTPTPLAPTDPGSVAQPVAVNAAGLVVGSATVAPGLVHAVEWTDASTFVDLDPGDVNDSLAAAVNAHGDVAGSVTTATTSNAFRRLALNNIVTPLHSIGAAVGAEQALGIDDAGDVVGASGATPVVWPAGLLNPIALPVDNAVSGIANGIAPSGEFIAGTVTLADTTTRAAVWASDGAGGFASIIVNFPPLGANASAAAAVNDDGLVVGTIDTSATAWRKVIDSDTGALVSFTFQTLPQSGAGASASGVSPAGFVAGADHGVDGALHATVWRPRTDGTFLENDLGLGLAASVDDASLVCGQAGDVASSVGALWQLAASLDHAPVTAPDVVTAHLGPGDALLVQVDAGDPRAVLLNDSDPDGDRLTVVEAGIPLSTPGGGILTFDIDGGFTYVPVDAAARTDIIDYDVTDGTLTTPSTLTIVIHNAPPAVVDAAAHFHPSLANAFTYDSTADALSFVALATDADGDPVTVVEAGTTVASAHGSFTVNDDGSFAYQPEQSYVGVDALIAHVTDGVSDPVVAGIALAVDDQPPVEDALVFPLDATGIGATGNVVQNASDADGDTISGVAKTFATTHGLATVDETGELTWSASTGAALTDDETFTVDITDGWSVVGASVTVALPREGVVGGVVVGRDPVGQCIDVCGGGCGCSSSTPADVFMGALLILLVRRGRRNARPSS
jgi:probable HAF family extracellular repeat protein